MAPHLVICVSAHGYGHIGQTAPVLLALKRRLPGLRVTVRSGVPGFKVSERFGTWIEHQKAELDFGMVQRSALEVNTDASADAYRVFHECWSERVSAEAETLRQLQPDLLLANIPYLPLMAAHQEGIPAVALCSLCWADIYSHFFGGATLDAVPILDQMLESYNSAQVFLRPTPSMPMHGIKNGRSIGPIAQLGRARRADLFRETKAAEGDRLIMVSLGGMEARFPIENWENLAGLHFIVPKAWETNHPCATAFERLGIPFPDALASCDALIAKPGYGSFVEAACLGIPVLYVERPNWPEVPFLVEWLEGNGACQSLDADDIAFGDFRSKLEGSWASLALSPPKPSGNDDAADCLAGLLGSSFHA